jgi:outer membrane protein assembly factor BamB
MDNPIDLAFDGQNIWVLHSEGEDAFDNLLLRVNPAQGLLEQMPPVMLGDMESPDNRIVEMLFDGSKLWFLLPQSFNSPQLINLIPENGEKFMQFEFMDCQAGGCLPAEGLGYDGQMIWATGNNQVWAINKGSGQRYLSYEVGWLTSGEMAYDGECLWMAGETGLVAFHPEGNYHCPGSENSYALPPGPVVFDGQRIWTADRDSDAVYWLDLDSGNISAPIVVGSEPSSLAFDGELLWTANAGDDTLVGIEVHSQEVKYQVATGSRPVALLFDGLHIWVANAGDNTLQRIDIGDF